MRSFMIRHWGKILLSVILFCIITLNIKPGYYILGNDNYSPELNPHLSFRRYLESPAWRGYRVFGIPSDSEQADVVRSGIFSLLEYIAPKWSIVQIYIFIAFFIAGFSAGALAQRLFFWITKEKREVAFFIGGLIYITSLVTSWMYYSPLMVFLAGWAFLPFVLWRLACVFDDSLPSQYLWLLVSVAFLTTSAMVPTTFIVEAGIILLFLFVFWTAHRARLSRPELLRRLVLSLIVVFATQFFWMGPFALYVKTNAAALKDSYINRVLTPQLIENEVNANTIWNVPKLYFSWIDINNDDGTPQFGPRDWYHTGLIQSISLLPFVLLIIGTVYFIKKKRWEGLPILGLFVLGWFLIVGVNPPFGWIFEFLQRTIPLFKQVFRWQSSKLFPTLTVPFALLGSLGVITVLHLVDRATNSSVMRRTLSVAVIGGVSISLLWFVRPYFFGNLIGKDNLVQIPSEYFALKEYLSQHDPKSRIYLAPEANTLYFRNYTWGFFGSSFMNYLVPNPVVEFGLTTGSEEAQAGQKLIERAYNGEDSSMFIQALRRYKTPLVLLDGYAGRLHNGYMYDTDRMDQMIRHNGAFTRIWQQGKLELYKVSDDKVADAKMYISDGHDWLRLNSILAFDQSSQKDSYVTTKAIAGSIYPFALAFEKATTNESDIVLESTYQGPSQTFSQEIDPAVTTEGYTRVQYDVLKKQLLVSPALPRIDVNGTSVPQPVEEQYYHVDSGARFLTIGKTVVDILKDAHGVVVASPYTEFAKQSMIWKDAPNVVNFAPGYQKKYVVPIAKDGIAEFTLHLAARNPMVVNICVYSTNEGVCINKDHALYLSSTPVTETFTTDRIIQEGDSLELYIASVDGASTENIEVSAIAASVFTSSKSLGKSIQTFSDGRKLYQSAIYSGDKISLTIPKAKAEASYHFSSADERIPPVTATTCSQNVAKYLLRPINSGSIAFHSENCTDQVKVSFTRIRPPSRSLAMVFMQGSNAGGIPAIVSVRQDKSAYKNFEDRLPYESAGFSLAYFPLPDELISYILEVYSYSPGVSVSRNILDDLTFQFIPQAWFGIHLDPVSEGLPIQPLQNIQGTNEASNTNWKGNGEPVRINGWEQGFINTVSNTSYQFWPNVLSWIGYIIDGVILVSLLLWQGWELLGKSRKPKLSSPTHP